MDAPLFAHVSETFTLLYTLRRNLIITTAVRIYTHAHQVPFRRFHRQTSPDCSWFLFPWFLFPRAFTGPASWFLFPLTRPAAASHRHMAISTACAAVISCELLGGSILPHGGIDDNWILFVNRQMAKP